MDKFFNLRKRYRSSSQHLKKVSSYIPNGSQTFSKSYLQFPTPYSPLYIEKGLGGIVWDIDGNKYIDFVAGLLSISLGYNDKDVNKAIKKQLRSGINFSLSSSIELELAEKLIRLIPCAEMCKFGKNGSDSTTAAIRLSRACSMKTKVLCVGYHGWHDWYIGSTSSAFGVPESITRHTIRLNTYDKDEFIDTINRHATELACCIVEPPMTDPECLRFLKIARDICSKKNIILIFDETVTGFRLALGGAQEYFNVIPDMATFGKAIGNGMPISILVGKRKLMKHFDEVFYSATFAGECLSIASANAVITKMQEHNVIRKTSDFGFQLIKLIENEVELLKLGSLINIVGYGNYFLVEFGNFYTLSRDEVRTVFTIIMLKHGILTNGSFAVSYALSCMDINRIFFKIRKALHDFKIHISYNDLWGKLNINAIQPVLKKKWIQETK